MLLTTGPSLQMNILILKMKIIDKFIKEVTAPGITGKGLTRKIWWKRIKRAVDGL